jgi:molybdenum cofactor cytidylyltransferase
VIAGIILAAGASRRMGSPKALLDLYGETFLDRLLRIFSRFCDPLIVVAGVHAEEIRAHLHLKSSRAQLVINPDPDRGQLSSLQTALTEVPASATGFLFIPVDCPTVEEHTIAALIAEFRRQGTPFVIPKFEGKRGHPVCAAASTIVEFLALPPTAETRAIVNKHADEIAYLDVDDPGILADIDTREAYKEMTR